MLHCQPQPPSIPLLWQLHTTRARNNPNGKRAEQEINFFFFFKPQPDLCMDLQHSHMNKPLKPRRRNAGEQESFCWPCPGRVPIQLLLVSNPTVENRRNRVMMFIYPHSHFCSQLLLTNTKHIRKQAEIVNLAQRNILHTEIAFFFLLKQGSKSASSYIILMRSLIKALPAQSSIFRSLNHSFGYSRLSS